MNGYGSKIRKVNRCWPAVSNETILATKQEIFFTKVTPVQSMSNIVLLDFWLMLLSWMFISSCTTIYFFVNKFFFSNVYISVNTIFENGHQLSTSATSRRDGEDHPICVNCVYGGGGCHVSCVRTHLYYLVLCFWQHLGL